MIIFDIFKVNEKYYPTYIMIQTIVIDIHTNSLMGKPPLQPKQVTKPKLRRLSYGSKLNTKEINRVPINSNKSLSTKTNAE